MKHLCLAVNISHVVFGILVIICGSMWLDGFPNFTHNDYLLRIQSIPIVTIVLGCTVLLVSCIGFFAIGKNDNCCIMIYTNLLVLLIILHIELIFWIHVSRPGFLKDLKQEFSGLWDFDDEVHSHHRNTIQMKLKCCGLNNYIDYTAMDHEIPVSCCGKWAEKSKCNGGILIQSDRLGCKERVFDFFEANMDIIEYFGICIVFIELLTIIMTWIIVMRYRKRVHF